MKAVSFFLGCIAAVSSAAQSNTSEQHQSKQILPDNFKPPQVFKNANLVRNINLDKSYARETVNVVIENTSKEPQDKYYVPFESDVISRIGSFEARDKKDDSLPPFQVEVTEYDTESTTEFYKIKLPQPLKAKEQQTISITYTVLSPLSPLPKQVEQDAPQYVQYLFSALSPSAYTTSKQKTKLKLPTGDVPDFDVLPKPNAEGKEDPQRQGSIFTYGPYNDIPAGAEEFVSVRYEFTKPMIHATRLERDLEVSHWGGNIATEERYWLTNRAAQLKEQFSRVNWQMTQFRSPATHALKEMRMPLKVGSVDAYFTDDIGNVSTSRFRTNARESNLEIKPRYPLFGDWKYNFRVGWNGDLKGYVRKLSQGDGYILKAAFLEGPKMQEGIEYSHVEVNVILPEGASNVNFETSVPIVSHEISLHRTFMDTIGRTTLKLTAINLSDDLRDRDLIVTYDYPFSAQFTKPFTIFGALCLVFGTAWIVGSLDVSIGKKKNA